MSGMGNILMWLIIVGLVTTLVSHSGTASVINAAWSGFNSSLGTAIKG